MKRGPGPQGEVVDVEGGAEHPLLGSPRRDFAGTILLAALTALLFILMATRVRTSIQGLDDAFLRRMVAVRSSSLTAVAKVLNVLGSAAITWPARVIVAGFLALKRRWWHLAAFASAMILSEISIGLVKSIYDRARPPGTLVTVHGSSFPSGHAVAASVTAVAAVIALFPEGPRRFWWGAAAALFSMVMGLSRAYLAAHWLSDAVAGVLLGTSIALVSAVVVHAIREPGLSGG